MKKFTIRLVTLLLTFIIFSSTVFAANSSSQSTSYTYSKDIVGDYNIGKDAYNPNAVISGLGMNNPSDLYSLNDKLYIADTGNKRVLVVDLPTNEVMSVGEGLLQDPQGISADADGYIYVADVLAEKAFIFKPNGELHKTISRPTTPNYGSTQSFKPTKIIPTPDKGAYIISQGNNAGIAHFSGEGEFLGYFASNEVSKSLSQSLMSIVLTDTQESKFIKLRPANYENIFLGNDGLIYTVNKGPGVTVSKHAINGTNILADGKAADYSADFVMDLFVDENGRIFLIQQNGKILVLSADGQEICEFGGLVEDQETVGLFKKPTGIALYHDDVYVLDAERNNIQIFTPSDNQTMIYSAIDLYNQGQYAESQAILEDVLAFDNTLYLGHYYLGKNYLQQQEYQKAADEFKICGEKELYSEAYWELRNAWLQANLGYVLLGVVLVSIILFVLSKINKKKKFISLKRPREAINKRKHLSNFCKIPQALVHPIDFAYDIKVGKKGDVLTSIFMLILSFAVLVGIRRFSGYLFSVPVYDFSLISLAVVFFGALLLFVVANYYISELNDGNGTLRSIFISTAYALAPLLLIGPFAIIIRHFSTFNEGFIVSAISMVIMGWSFFNLVIMLMELHEYSFGKMFKNLLLTVFAMAVIVITLSITYGLIKQVIDFVVEIVRELVLRV